MWFAQVPPVSFDDMARFSVCVVLLAWVVQLLVNIYRQIRPYQPPPKQGEMYVTHEQFDLFETKMNAKIDKLSISVESRMSNFTQEFGTKLKEVDSYLHTSQHTQANHLQKQAIALAQIQTIMALKFGMKEWAASEQQEDEK